MYKNKFSYEFVRNFFKIKGCILISKEYINARSHLEYICSCGNISKIIFDSFRRGHRCNKCAQKSRSAKNRLNYKSVSEYVRKHNCLLLSKKYISSHHKLKIECKCGNIFFRNFCNFKNNKQYFCRSCSINNRSGSNHYEWKKDRKLYLENCMFRQKCYKILKRTLKKIGLTKIDRTMNILGYTHLDLKEHIHNHANWNNVKDKKWNIDHIFPIKAFIDHDIKDIKIINCLDNLQPLLENDNFKKNDSYNVDDFKLWLTTQGVRI